MKHIAERTCMGCNKKNEKQKLIRIVNTKDGIFVDKTGKMNGRGAYICNDVSCLEKVIKSKRLERCLKTKIEIENYERVRGVLFEQ